MVTPGGGLNSRVSNWTTAVSNPSEGIMTPDFYTRGLRDKVLPVFDEMSEDTDKAEHEVYERVATHGALERFDPTNAAEQAMDAGICFDFMAQGGVQGIVNMFTAGLYHLFEQQQLRLYRQQ
jgi:hypothetical protein